MKKMFALSLCFVLFFSLCACKKDDTQTASDNVPDTASFQEGSGNLNKTVEMQLPLAAIDEKYRDDLDTYCEVYGYKKAKKNAAGTAVKITMSEFSYNLLVSQIGINAVRSIYDIQESGDFRYVKEIVSLDKDNFSAVTISVDREGFVRAGDEAVHIIGQSCILYQIYAQNKKIKCEITVIDADTNETIKTIKYTDKNI